MNSYELILVAEPHNISYILIAQLKMKCGKHNAMNKMLLVCFVCVFFVFRLIKHFEKFDGENSKVRKRKKNNLTLELEGCEKYAIRFVL